MSQDIGRHSHFEHTVEIRHGNTRKCAQCGLDVSVTQSACPVDGTPIEPLLREGSTLDGRYEFISLIGSGGMGVIYKARQIVLNKTVAIKMLHTELINDKALKRFQREGKAASALSHPNIIAVHDFAISEHGQPYMVMDYVEGKTLEDLIGEEGGLEIDYTIDAMIQICDGLSHAHKNGVLHRDLKPSNVLIVGDNPPKMLILDFGIAKIIDTGDSGTASLTQTGDTLGSPLYMSPEQCNGEKIDKRTELYNLGATMYECLTGLPPFVGATLANIIVKIANEQAPPMKDASLGKEFPPRLERIVMKLLSKKAEDRYQSADELKLALENYRDGVAEVIVPSRLDPGKLALVKPARSKSAVAAAAVACVLALSLVGLTVYQFSKKPEVQKADPVTTAGASESSTAAVKNLELKNAVRDYVNKNPSATIINLGYWEIADDDMAPLAEETACQELGLPGNSIKGPGLQNIEGMTSMNSLRLDKNDLGDDALVHLSKMTSLNRLNLSLTHVTGAGLIAMKDCPLAFLDLSHTKITADKLAPLSNFKQLGNLNVDDTRFNDECVKHIMPLHDLHVLDLSHTQIGNRGIAELSKLDGIRELWLTGDAIDDSCMKDISQMKGLIQLDISATAITAEGIRQLANSKSLTTVYCAGAKGDLVSAFTEIKRHLPGCMLVPQSRRG